MNHWFRIVSLQSKSNEHFAPGAIFIEYGWEKAVTLAEIFNKKRRADIAGELMFQKSRLGGRLIVAGKRHENSRWAGQLSTFSVTTWTVHINPILPNWSGYNFHERGRVLEIHVARTLHVNADLVHRQTDRETAERNRKTAKRATPDDEANQVTQQWLTCDAALKHPEPGSLEATFLETR